MNTAPGSPPADLAPLDPRKIRRSFARAAASYDTADFLQTEIRSRLLERLTWISLEPGRVVDLGAGTGKALSGLATRFPGAQVLALDLTETLVQRAADRDGSGALAVCADASRLPLTDGSVDLVFSCLMLHWCPSLDQVFREVRRCLRYPGLFTFATLGPKSFQELRTAWQRVDQGVHVMPFPEMRALADGLVRAGFAEPVVDGENLTIHYRTLPELTADLRRTGTTNASSLRQRGLTGRRQWQRFAAALEELREGEGTLPMTLDIIYGQAWAPGATGTRKAAEASVPLTHVRRRPG